MSSTLFKEVDKLLDKEEVDKILLTLEHDLIQYEVVLKDLKEVKAQLTFIDKINPFGERDKKGEILKIKYELEEIARVYNQDIKVIREKASQAIKSIDVFVAKFQMNSLIRSIQNIEVRYHGRVKQKNLRDYGIKLDGKDKALAKANKINSTLEQTYGELYKICPSYKTFIESYMAYLTEPYQIPLILPK